MECEMSLKRCFLGVGELVLQTSIAKVFMAVDVHCPIGGVGSLFVPECVKTP